MTRASDGDAKYAGAVIDPRQRFEAGLSSYRAGDHYEAHEIWEELWDAEQDDDRRGFLQALIQLASAVHKAQNDVAPKGALRLAARALERFANLPDTYLSVDVAALRGAIAVFTAEVARQLASSDGHCRMGAQHVPAIVQRGATPLWLRREAEPAVPAAARAAWFERGLAAYRAGEYFDAHELWEEIWRDEVDEYEKQFLQGLIQVAAAMHKTVEQRKPAPAARLLGRALLRLRRYVPRHGGLDVARLVLEAEKAQGVLAGMNEGALMEELRPRLTTVPHPHPVPHPE